MRLTIYIYSLILVVWSAGAVAIDDKEVQNAVELAKQTFEQAVKEQGGWVSTKKLISSAELSATKGDREAAIKLAEQAKQEAELSLQQAQNQKQNWSEPAYLK